MEKLGVSYSASELGSLLTEFCYYYYYKRLGLSSTLADPPWIETHDEWRVQQVGLHWWWWW
jgi:hypothetical protein